MDCSTPGRLPFLSPGVCPSSWPLSWWCYLTISFSAGPFSFAFNLCQHQYLLQWVDSSHVVVKVLELQLQYQSFQWIFRVDFDFQVILTMSSEGKSCWPGTASPSRAQCWSYMGLWQCGVQGLGDFLMNQDLTSSEVWLPSWHSCWLVGTQRCVYLSESIPANNRLTLIGWLTKVYSVK